MICAGYKEGGTDACKVMYQTVKNTRLCTGDSSFKSKFPTLQSASFSFEFGVK